MACLIQRALSLLGTFRYKPRACLDLAGRGSDDPLLPDPLRLGAGQHLLAYELCAPHPRGRSTRPRICTTRLPSVHQLAAYCVSVLGNTSASIAPNMSSTVTNAMVLLFLVAFKRTCVRMPSSVTLVAVVIAACILHASEFPGLCRMQFVHTPGTVFRHGMAGEIHAGHLFFHCQLVRHAQIRHGPNARILPPRRAASGYRKSRAAHPHCGACPLLGMSRTASDVLQHLPPVIAQTVQCAAFHQAFQRTAV